jgi:hypothetical protein
MIRWALAGAALLTAVPAAAQDLRFCPTRPSLGSSACITDPGHVHLEIGAVDWERDDRSDARDDQVIAADMLARIGVGSTTELQIGWTGFGHVRDRDKQSGGIETTNGVGDVTLGVRQNFLHPDGKGLSIGIQPFVTLPTGRSPIGAGDYALGVIIPVSYDLSDSLNLNFTGEVDDAADETRDGHHAEYSGIVGLGYQLSKQVTVVGEMSLARVETEDRYETRALAAGSIAWQPRQGLQLDRLTVAGLNRTSPDVRVALGGAVLF